MTMLLSFGLLLFVSGRVMFCVLMLCWCWAVVLDVNVVDVRDLCVVNGASPVGFVLSLFYLYAFQMNSVRVWLFRFHVCCLFIGL